MDAHRSFGVLLATLVLTVGFPLAVLYAEQPTRPNLPGEFWYRGDGLGYNVTVNLGADGRYMAQWTGCLGIYGNSEGEWTEDDQFITLQPSKEGGMMVGHLRQLRKLTLKGETVLVPPADVEEVLRYAADGGFSHVWAFKRREADDP